MKTVTYPDGSTIQYQYDSAGRMSGIINERGYLEVFNTYDANNRVLTQTHADNGVYTFNYTVAGGYITQTDMTEPNEGTTRWAFNSSGYITSMTTPYGPITYERDSVTNLLKSVTDPLGRKMTYTYYAATDPTDGLVKTVTDNLGNLTSYEYETKYGLPTKVKDPIGQTTGKAITFTYTFDAGNRLTKTDIRDQLLNLTTINYNTYGMPTSMKDPNNNTTTFIYENTNKPSEITKIINPPPLSNEVKMTYDSLGRIASVTDEKGKSTYYTYDLMDRVKSVTDANDGVTEYTYDAKGNLITMRDPMERAIQYEYDERDRLKKMTDQLQRFEIYTYDTNDNLRTYTDKKGQTTTFNTYDLMNRVKHITYHDGSYTDYTYDGAGRLDYINDSISGYIDYTYNDFGCSICTGRGMDRISKEVTPLGTIDYTYDKVGRRLSMTLAGQQPVNYEYYDNGLPKEIRQTMNGVERKFDFDYDPEGRRMALQYFVGAASTPTMNTTYGYDIANRLLNIQHLQSTNVLENLLYEYDANGNRTKFTRNEPQTLRSDSASSACGTKTYNFDVKNRLISISGFDAQCSPLSASFKYDVLGRRIEKTVNGVTTQYVYDGLDIIQEIQGGVKTNYVRTLNIDEPLSRIKADGTIRHYKSDALGSVIALTDDTGGIKTTYTYDPFGNTTVSGENSDNPLQYTGRENDGRTGLYYYRARYYSPELQRFISEDPIGLEGEDINFFTYVWNNPVNFKDPLGLRIIPPYGGGYEKCMEKAPKDCKNKYDNCNKNCESNQCSYEKWKDPLNRDCGKVCMDEFIWCITKKIVISIPCNLRYIPRLKM